jgi:hypothetical protein
MDVHQQHVPIDELTGYTITAISMCKLQIVVKLATASDEVYLICKNATLSSVSMDSFSLLRLSPEDRCVVRVYTIRMDKDLFLLFVLSGGDYLTICAEAIAVGCPSSTGI